jgi:hypothetical protein
MDPWRAPERVGQTDITNEPACLERCLRPAPLLIPLRSLDRLTSGRLRVAVVFWVLITKLTA